MFFREEQKKDTADSQRVIETLFRIKTLYAVAQVILAAVNVI